MTKENTISLILGEMIRKSRKGELTKAEIYQLPDEYAERIIKLFAIPDVVCSCCGKNTPEICGSCVSDIAQGTAEQSIGCR